MNITNPASGGFAITPDDDDDLPSVTAGLWVGTQGDLEVVMADGTLLVWPNAVGWTPIQVIRVKAGNTTASGIVGYTGRPG